MIDENIRVTFEKRLCKFTSDDLSIKNDGKCISTPIKIGNPNTGHSILLCGKRKSSFPFQLFIGPDWPMLILVYTLILIPNIIILPIVFTLGLPVQIIGLFGFLGLLYCYSAVSCSDPGIVFDDRVLKVDSVDNIDEEKPIWKAEQSDSLIAPDESNVFPDNSNDRSFAIESSINDLSTDSEDDPSRQILGQTVSNVNGINVRYADIQVQSTPTTSGANIRNAAAASSSGAPTDIECGQCDIRRPYTARHCHHCGVCIDQLDHHCPCTLYSSR